MRLGHDLVPVGGQPRSRAVLVREGAVVLGCDGLGDDVPPEGSALDAGLGQVRAAQEGLADGQLVPEALGDAQPLRQVVGAPLRPGPAAGLVRLHEPRPVGQGGPPRRRGRGGAAAAAPRSR